MCAIDPPYDLAGCIFEVHPLKILGIPVVMQSQIEARQKLLNFSLLDSEMPFFTRFRH
jgi:hypothetical protein